MVHADGDKKGLDLMMVLELDMSFNIRSPHMACSLSLQSAITNTNGTTHNPPLKHASGMQTGPKRAWT